MTASPQDAAAPETAPPVVSVLNATSLSPIILVCEHASNYIPPEYAGLGLSAAERHSHIAWDIGAEGVTRKLAQLLDAPAFIAGLSRLLIDGNRPIGAPTSIPELSERTVIPGNIGLTAQEKERRARRFFWPLHDELADFLDRRVETGPRPRLVAIHSFAPVFHGEARPWHAGVLFRRSAAWGGRLVAALRRPERPVVANEPYRIEDESDYLVPVHGEARGLEAVLIEIRQDLVASAKGQAAWAHHLAAALTG